MGRANLGNGVSWPEPGAAAARPEPHGLKNGLRMARQALAGALKIAPSGTTPCKTKRHSATSSFRATATIAMRWTRPRAVPTRVANHRLITEAGW